MIAAGVLVFLAWVVATVLRFVVRQVLTTTKIDRRLTHEAGVEKQEDYPVAKTLSDATYWLVYLLFLPALLDALAVPGLLAPVRDMVTKILGFMPNLLAAAVILGIGWFVARIVQRVATNLLVAAGADRLSQRVGLSGVIGDNKLSVALGLVVYILILVPVIVGSLNALRMEAVTGPASHMLNIILGTLPGILAAVLVVGVAYIVARLVSGLTTNMLAAIGFDKLPARLGLAAKPVEGHRTPSQIAGTVVTVAIVLFATMQALPMLGFDLLAGMMGDFLTFAQPRVAWLGDFRLRPVLRQARGRHGPGFRDCQCPALVDDRSGRNSGAGRRDGPAPDGSGPGDHQLGIRHHVRRRCRCRGDCLWHRRSGRRQDAGR